MPGPSRQHGATPRVRRDAGLVEPAAPTRPGPIGLRVVPVAAMAVPLILGLLAWDQPILEGYVGRQVPTAMVARNLGRETGVFRPQLDTGPFPNLFLVEPPIYAGTVALARGATGLPLDGCGRMVSSLGMALAGWAVAGLILRREGWRAIVLAPILVLPYFPVCVRYGRAFQPDALALGLVLAGIRAWDAHERIGGRWRIVLAWALT